MIPVIILNWNGIADTLECIAALEQQTNQNFFIWLVDNGSGHAEVNQLKSTFANYPKVSLVLNADNLGFTAGNNRILEKILEFQNASPYVVLLNNDTVPTTQWLEELVHTAQEQHADMVSSKMINYFDQDRMDNAGHMLLNTLEVLPTGHDEPVDNYNIDFENAGACGGAALYSVSMLREIGIFDEHFTNGYEDVELGLRAILCGYKAVYAPAAIVAHKGSQSINKIRNFGYTLDIQRHIYYITYKLFPWPVILLCFPFMVFRFIAALVINLFALRWKYLRIQITAVYYLLLKDLKTIKEARRTFFKMHRTISTRRIVGKMHSFWKYDWARFKKNILRKEKMVFERY